MYFRDACNFTPDESQFFELRSRDYSLEDCAEMMSTSVATAARLSKRVKDKIGRTLPVPP